MRPVPQSTARRHTVGLALSETHLYAVCSASSATADARTWVLPPLGRTDTEWPALVAALTELKAVFPERYRSVAIAFLPPLAQVRRVELPKLRAGELRLVLSRNAARYLPGVREPQTAAGIALASSSPVPYLMAAAPTRLVEAVARAVQQSGWTLATIVPAHVAWSIAAQHEWSGHQSGDVAVHVNGHIEILQVQKSVLTAVRRQPTEEPLPAGVSVLDRPEYAAAAAAPAAGTPELLPERIYMQRAQARRQHGIRLVTILAAAVVLASVGVLARARYVLRQVEAQRLALASRAGQAVAARKDIAAVTTPLDALGHIETNAVLWSQVMADLTEVLPPDAYLTEIHTRGDSLAVAGSATHGGDVFERMDGAKLIDNVRPAGPIRHETSPDAPSVDQFSLVARIPGAAPLYAAPKHQRGRPQP